MNKTPNEDDLLAFLKGMKVDTTAVENEYLKKIRELNERIKKMK